MKTLMMITSVSLSLALIGCRTEVEVVEVPAVDTAVTGVSGNDLISTIQRSDRFDAFMQGIRNSYIDQLLKGPGPYTVLVPTQQAWDDLPGPTRENLFVPANSDNLRNLMLNHIIAGRLTASDLATRQSVLTLAGTTIPVRTSGTEIYIGDAKLIEPDLPASNGVIQVINGVLPPPSKQP